MTEETPWPRDDDATRERFAPPAFWWALGVLAIIAAVAVYRYTREPEQPVRQSAPPPVVRPEAPSTPVETANAPKYPVPPVGEPSSLPVLTQSNGFVQQALTKLIGGDAVARLFYPDDIVRRFVATVDNLPRKGSLSQARVMRPPAGSFLTSHSGDNVSIDPVNERRYTAYVQLAESTDTNALVALYLRLYPLFEEQYRLLGYPSGHFNDRLIEAIDDLLAAPEVPPPVALVQPKTMYQFADANLEQLSAGQKAMIRLGTDNAKRVKAKLRAIRAALSVEGHATLRDFAVTKARDTISYDLRSPYAMATLTRIGNRTKDDLLNELDSLQREVERLRSLAQSSIEAKERAERLATFPEENPNPVIEMNFEGVTSYLNPAASSQFPELWQEGRRHPLMKGLRFPFVPKADEDRSYVVREIAVGDSIYEQKVCYMGPSHIRIYVHDITRRKRAEETNQELLKRLVDAHEEERQRVSRELHDEAGQALTALKLSLELIQREIPAGAKAVRGNLKEAIHLTEATKEQIRMLARGLRPPALDALGLNLTLESFCRDFAKRTQLRIDYHGSDVPELSDAANMCLYRSLQEALANVVKHAGATRVVVSLLNDGAYARLIVEDNGAGLTADGKRSSSRSKGIGLLGMRERLDLFRGSVDIGRGETGGLRLSVCLPLSPHT